MQWQVQKSFDRNIFLKHVFGRVTYLSLRGTYESTFLANNSFSKDLISYTLHAVTHITWHMRNFLHVLPKSLEQFRNNYLCPYMGVLGLICAWRRLPLKCACSSENTLLFWWEPEIWDESRKTNVVSQK